MKHPLNWFKIGKTVYRKPRLCGPDCDLCPRSEVLIADKDTAYNMEMVQYDLDINYYDRPL